MAQVYKTCSQSPPRDSIPEVCPSAKRTRCLQGVTVAACVMLDYRADCLMSTRGRSLMSTNEAPLRDDDKCGWIHDGGVAATQVGSHAATRPRHPQQLSPTHPRLELASPRHRHT